MRETLKRLARFTAGYSLVSFLGPALTLLLTPLYTRVLNPADYGVVDVTLTLGSIIILFALLGFDQALSAHFFSVKESERTDLVTTSVIYTLVTGAVLGFAVILFSRDLAILLFNDESRAIILVALSIQIISNPAYLLLSSSFKLGMKVKQVNILGFVFALSLATLNVLMILALKFGAMGVVFATSLANAIGLLAGLSIFLRIYRGKFRPEFLKRMWRSGIAIFPGIAGFVLLTGIDRLMLTQFVTENEIGLYSIANKLASIVFVVVNTAWMAWWPLGLEMSRKPEAPRIYARIFEYFLCASMLIALVIGLFSPEILKCFTRQVYVDASSYTLWLVIYTGPIALASSAFQIGIYTNNTVKLSSVAFVISAMSNIALNLILMPAYGAGGAVMATLLSGFLLLLILHVFERNILFVPYRLGRIILLLIAYLVIVTTSALSDLKTLSISTRAVELVLFVLAIHGLGFIRLDQYSSALQFAKHQLKKS